ncbi:MAG: polysaccharide biosynthesis/export family protein [Parasphingorhabdus sp.]|uniref:polysaccharide biosynthesis/export family protein n=1 Tax=Parasphingorhabdus sp. TaxID=2709688 RepID=UPI00300166EF
MRNLILILSLTLAGCASTSNLPVLELSVDQAVYKLGSGDQVKITVYGEEKLTGTYPINGQGRISFPLIGELQASEKTVSEFETMLRTALAEGFLNEPNVVVEVLNYRPYYILGEVGKPGEYPFVNGLTIFSAVARAGGFGYRADKKRIYIRHTANKDELLYKLEGGTPVQPGDTIRVAERSF